MKYYLQRLMHHNALFISAAFVGISFITSCSTNNADFEQYTQNFISSLERLDRDLKVGQNKMISIGSVNNADIIILPSYENRDSIQKHLKITDQKLINKIYKLSTSDNTAPAILWVKDGAIVGSSLFTPNVRLELKLMHLKTNKNTAKIIVEKVIVENGTDDALQFRMPKKKSAGVK